MHARDFYVQPDAADPVLDADTVLAIVRRHASRALAVTAVDEHGGEARTYAIDEDLILKVQRPQQLRPRTSLAKERFLLRLAHEHHCRTAALEELPALLGNMH